MSVYSIAALIVLPVAGGFIAWAGDVIGYRLGKRRSSLFGLRPRTTARTIGIAVGVLLPMAGLAVAAAGSENVRIALFQLDALRDDQARLLDNNRDLQHQVQGAEANARHAQQRAAKATAEGDRLATKVNQGQERLQRVKGQLRGVQRELERANGQLAALKAETSKLREEREQLTDTNQKLNGKVEGLKSQYAELDGEYEELQAEYDHTHSELAEATAELETAQQEIVNLQETETTLRSNIATLNGRIPDLNSRIANLQDNIADAQEELEAKREELEAVQWQLLAWQLGAKGPVAYEPGEEIFRRVMDTHQTRDQIESSLNEWLLLASRAAQALGVQIGETGRAVRVLAPVPPGETLGKVSEEVIVKAVARQIVRSEESSFVVSIRALARAFQGQPEPVWVELWRTPNHRVFREGETIVSVQIDGGAPRDQVFQDLWLLLGQMRRTAQNKRVLPVLRTGQYGEVAAEEMLAALDSLLEAGQPTVVTALATVDVYTANQQPFSVTLQVQ